MYLVLASAQELEVTLEEYFIFLRSEGKSARTVAAYGWHLARLLAWLSGRGVVSPRQVTRLLLREWCAGLYTRWQPSTIKQAVSASRSFFKWLKDERLIEDNPALALRSPKEKLKEHRTVTAAEILILLAGCDDSVKGLRDAALVLLLYDSGLRASEVCRLTLADLDLGGRKLRAIVKGGDKLPGWFGEGTEAKLRAWLAVRAAWPGEETVFVSVGGTRPGTQLTSDGLRCILRNLGNRCGVANLSPHAFRRGFAVKLSGDGVPDNILKDFGRWSTVNMIKRYTLAQQVGILYPQYSPVDRILAANR